MWHDMLALSSHVQVGVVCVVREHGRHWPTPAMRRTLHRDKTVTCIGRIQTRGWWCGGISVAQTQGMESMCVCVKIQARRHR